MRIPTSTSGRSARQRATDLHSNFLPSDYRRRIVDARVSKVVHVSAVPETRYYVDELRWLDGIVASSGFEVACVGWRQGFEHSPITSPATSWRVHRSRQSAARPAPIAA